MKPPARRRPGVMNLSPSTIASCSRSSSSEVSFRAPASFTSRAKRSTLSRRGRSPSICHEAWISSRASNRAARSRRDGGTSAVRARAWSEACVHETVQGRSAPDDGAEICRAEKIVLSTPLGSVSTLGWTPRIRRLPILWGLAARAPQQVSPSRPNGFPPEN